MIAEKDLLEAIEELKSAPASYSNCQKLATFCTVCDFLYGKDEEAQVETANHGDPMLSTNCESEFLAAVDGKRASKVLAVMAELMTALEIVQPKMYAGVLRRLER